METLYEDEKISVIRYGDGSIRIKNLESESGQNFLIVTPWDNGELLVSAPNSRWNSIADGYNLSLQEYPQ